MLFNRKDVDVNEKVRHSYDSNTILEYICENKQKTTLGVELLLNNHQTQVDQCGYTTPLYLALQNVESEGDYFYKVNQMLLSRKDIDVNAKYCNDASVKGLSRLAWCGYKG